MRAPHHPGFGPAPTTAQLVAEVRRAADDASLASLDSPGHASADKPAPDVACAIGGLGLLGVPTAREPRPTTVWRGELHMGRPDSCPIKARAHVCS